MKRLVLAAFLCALCVGAVAVSAQAATSETDPCWQKGGNTSADGKCVLTIDAQVSVDYPLDLTQKYDIIGQTIDPVIAKAKDDFFSAVSGDFIPVPGPFVLQITYDTAQHSDTVMTLILTIYQFQGGAHGSTALLPFNFDLKNNKVLTLDDIFTSTPDAIKLIEPIVQSTVKTALGDMNVQDMLDAGTGTDPNNYQYFSLDADSITFYFQQYQVAPYAAGIQKVTIPFSQLTSVLKPGIAS
ncbi:MAG TPA: DUF3298 domain-containing protein [Phototrophicaceae bacterium]|nr:DUF3298 domain-containing protein [Phototrophicaceae bacterium]